MSSSDDDEDGERPSKTAKLETDFSLCLVCQKRKSKAQSKPKRESLINLMTYLQKYKQHGDTEYTAIYYRLRSVIVDLKLQSQGFNHKDCYSNIVNERNLERAVQR